MVGSQKWRWEFVFGRNDTHAFVNVKHRSMDYILNTIQSYPVKMNRFLLRNVNDSPLDVLHGYLRSTRH